MHYEVECFEIKKAPGHPLIMPVGWEPLQVNPTLLPKSSTGDSFYMVWGKRPIERDKPPDPDTRLA